MKMRSVTEQPALDEFLSTAELAGTDFTAEKGNNIKVISFEQRNPYLLSAAEERTTVRKHKANKARLTVPRRPAWDENTSKGDLERREKVSLLEWRRGLAELQEVNDILMTPFERNIEVWRQLWRVIERSDLVVQIVDARNPLLFRSEDLERYVKEVDPRKNNLLLVNKADMMTLDQRRTWADYFDSEGINYNFFSAALAKELNEARDLVGGEVTAGSIDVAEVSREAKKPQIGHDSDQDQWESEDDSEDEMNHRNRLGMDDRTRILTVDELEGLFLKHAPNHEGRSTWCASKKSNINDSTNAYHLRFRRATQDPDRARGLSQRGKVFNHKCVDWSQEGLRIIHSRENEALSDHSPKPSCDPV